jgi:hypothetical protein
VVRILVLVYLGGLLPAMVVTRAQWGKAREPGLVASLWALTWPLWILFWMVEQVAGHDGGR